MKKGNKKELLFYVIIVIIGVACMCLLMANAERIDKQQERQTQQTL